MFRRIFFAALLSGAIAGLFVSAVQSVRLIPLIGEAEKLERAHPAPVPPTREAGAGGRGFASAARAVVSNVLAAIGFALLLAACFALRGGVDWKEGILWGLGGFLVFGLAPALGLPPTLPGSVAAPVADRQLWWLLAAAGTASGLMLLAFRPGAVFKALGVALIALPHLLGAPRPEVPGGLAPRALLESFRAMALLASGLFWIVLGLCAGYFFARLGRE